MIHHHSWQETLLGQGPPKIEGCKLLATQTPQNFDDESTFLKDVGQQQLSTNMAFR